MTKTKKSPSAQLREREAHRASAMSAVEAIHMLGFTTVHVEDRHIASDAHHYCIITLDDSEVNHERMATLVKWCQATDSRLWLRSDMASNGVRHSRLAIWPGIV